MMHAISYNKEKRKYTVPAVHPVPRPAGQRANLHARGLLGVWNAYVRKRKSVPALGKGTWGTTHVYGGLVGTNN